VGHTEYRPLGAGNGKDFEHPHNPLVLECAAQAYDYRTDTLNDAIAIDVLEFLTHQAACVAVRYDSHVTVYKHYIPFWLMRWAELLFQFMQRFGYEHSEERWTRFLRADDDMEYWLRFQSWRGPLPV